MTAQAPLNRYIGDDWLFGPINLAAGGAPLDLTGCSVSGLFFQAFVATPVATLAAQGGGVTLASDLTTGQITQIKVPRTVTSDVPPSDRCAVTFPTRIQVVVTDPYGNDRTYALILILPLDPRVDVPPASS